VVSGNFNRSPPLTCSGPSVRQAGQVEGQRSNFKCIVLDKNCRKDCTIVEYFGRTPVSCINHKRGNRSALFAVYVNIGVHL